MISSPGYKLSCEGHNIPRFAESVFLGEFVIGGHKLGTHVLTSKVYITGHEM